MKLKRLEVYQVTDGGPQNGRWCRLWQTGIMPAPAFYYYDTEAEASGAVRNKCEQCARYDEAEIQGSTWVEVFQWHDQFYSLALAERLLREAPREPIVFSRQNAIGCGLPIDSDSQVEGRFVLDAHINHIPADRFEQPGIIAPAFREGERAAWILLDGGHRMTALFRAGAEDVLVYPLTIGEALLCRGFGVMRAMAYIQAHRAAFFHFSAAELDLAGIEYKLEGESDAQAQQ